MACDFAHMPGALQEARWKARLTPLLGSGFSQLADPEIPSWTEFLERLLGHPGVELSGPEHARLHGYLDRGKFRRAASVALKAAPSEVYLQLFEQSFGARRTPTVAHMQLVRLNAPLVITTNYDSLVEDSYALKHRRAPGVFTYRSAEAVRHSLWSWTTPVVLKVFGSAENPFDVVFDENSFSDLLFSSDLRSVLSTVFSQTVVVALGYSQDDPAARALFELASTLERPHYVVLGEDRADEADWWRDELGLEPIRCAAGEPMHDFLHAITEN